MKYENLESVISICEKIKAHKDRLERLKDNPIVVIHAGFMGISNDIEIMNPGPTRGPDQWAKTLVDTLIKDYESRVKLLELQLKSL